MDNAPHNAVGTFPPTHWTSIYLASDPAGNAGREALDRLLARYRQPLLMHLASRFNVPPHEAEDWFQAFAEKRILEKNLLKSARKDLGKFRTFLLNALDYFVTDELRRGYREKRRPPGGFVPADSLATTDEPASRPAADPGDVAWARSVLDRAVARLREFYLAKGRDDLWGAFDLGMLRPILEGHPPPTMAVLAHQFGFDSEAQASNALTTVKREFRKKLREIIEEYEPGTTAEEEIRELMAILGAG